MTVRNDHLESRYRRRIIMNKLKHTPGPWEYKCGHHSKVFFVTTKRGSELLRVTNRDDWNVENANARLIAAAPEMLESLIESFGYIYGKKDNPPELVDIIEKATGQPIESILESE
jgi:hypothetical protein